MKRIGLISIQLLLLSATSILAQCNCRFSSQNYLGLLEGEEGSAFQLQSVNGIRYKTWFTGIGVGLDYYKFRSVPLFLSVNKEFLLGRNSIYVLADGGLNIPWYKKEQGRTETFISRQFSSSLYWAGGVGYKIDVNKKRDAILLNVGYSYKHLKETQEKPGFCIAPPCANLIEKYDYRLNRLSLKIGWEF